MPTIPEISIQLIHIQGPSKGQIQDFFQFPVTIGRHPTCHVQYDKNMTTLSRQHARIEKHENRFRIIDESTNGTFVNGQRIAEVYLRDGDVITFSENGPKMSFLTKVESAGQSPVTQEPPQANIPGPQQKAAPIKAQTPTPVPSSIQQPQMASLGEKNQAFSPPAQDNVIVDPQVERVNAPLVIQYGPTLRNFNALPVTIGKHPTSDFIMDHPGIKERHVQIFYSQDKYWVKDLTGQNMIMINQQPVVLKSPLMPESVLSLSEQGPKFRFLGNGRLAEIEEPVSSTPDTDPGTPGLKVEKPSATAGQTEKSGSIFKKFFK